MLARQLTCAMVAVGILACDLSSSTEVQNPIDIALDFCDNDIPVWFAYQNENQSTATRVLPDGDGTFRFTATNRTSIALVFENGGDARTEMYHATNEELASVSEFGCLEEFGAKIVNGTLAGVGPGQAGVVSLGFSTVTRQAGNTSYTLTNLPDRPLDLVASRQNLTGGARIADRVVIRRTQSIASGGNVPAIDFTNAGDLVQPATANATISGILSGEFAFVQNNFFSQLETSHPLSYAEGLINGTIAFASVPQASLAQGDYHDLVLLSVNATIGSVRGAENFFRAAAPQTLALGPVLNDPTITDMSGGGSVRLRMQLPTQLAYDDAVSVEYRQQLATSAVTVVQVATAGYFGGSPGAWVLDTPDLTGAPGWEEQWELAAGTAINWTVTGFSGRAELLLGAQADDGEFARYAIRHSDPGAAAANRPSGSARNGSLRSVYTIRLRLRTP